MLTISVAVSGNCRFSQLGYRSVQILKGVFQLTGQVVSFTFGPFLRAPDFIFKNDRKATLGKFSMPTQSTRQNEAFFLHLNAKMLTVHSWKLQLYFSLVLLVVHMKMLQMLLV